MQLKKGFWYGVAFFKDESGANKTKWIAQA